MAVSCELRCGGNGADKSRELGNCGSVQWNYETCHRGSGVRENSTQTLLTDESKAEWEATTKADHGPRAAPGSSLGFLCGTRRHHKLAAFSSLLAAGPEQPELWVWMWPLVCSLEQLHGRASSLEPQSCAVLGFANENYLQQDPVQNISGTV